MTTNELIKVLAVFGVLPNGDGRLHGPCPVCRKAGFLFNPETELWVCEDGCFKSGEAEQLAELLRQRVGIRVADVHAEIVRWLWERRIPFAKITTFDGDPGLGKSLATLDIAAHVTRGRGLPDGGLIQAGNVLLMSAEDGPADTIRPRLEAAGADLDRIHILGDKGVGLLLPRDLERIGAAVLLHSAVLLVIDPVMAHLDVKVNSHRDQDVRSLVMAPLARMAEKTGVAILLVRHLNKGTTGNPLYRGGGSIGWVGAARSGLLIAEDPDDSTKRVLAPLKSNLSLPPRSLRFEVVETDGVPRVEWLGESSYRAGTLLREAENQEGTGRRREELDSATAFLRKALATGAVESEELRKRALVDGISKATLWRAKEGLDLKARKQRGSGTWTWELPEEVRADLQAPSL